MFADVETIEKPITLLVEDNFKNMKERAELLTHTGFHVITASTIEQAELELSAGPMVDLILTDVNLNPQLANDKSGIELAKYAKNKWPDIPVIGYSGKFSEDELSKDDIAVFDDIYDRGSSSYEKIIAMFNEWLQRALENRKLRRKMATDELERIKMKYNISPHDINLLREFTPAGNPDDIECGCDVEQILADAGYSLKIIDPSITDNAEDVAVQHPFGVWIKNTENAFIAEPYGYPGLFVASDTEEKAISDLMSLMIGYYNDLRHSRDEDLLDPAYKLKKFLIRIFGE